MSYWTRLHKFNQNHDEKGRFSSSGGGPTLAKRMYDAGKTSGFTYDAHGNTPTEGYSVGIHPERSGQFDEANVKVSDVQGWLDKNQKFAQSNGLHIGGWVDKGKLWLDVVKIFPTSQKAEAIAAGRQHNQIAIADMGAIHKEDWANAFIDTGGTGEHVKKQDAKNDKRIDEKQSQPRHVIFPPNITAKQLLAKMKITPKAEK